LLDILFPNVKDKALNSCLILFSKFILGCLWKEILNNCLILWIVDTFFLNVEDKTSHDHSILFFYLVFFFNGSFKNIMWPPNIFWHWM
jgi:hypothetical protein